MNIVYRDFDNFSPLALDIDKKKSDTFGHVLGEDSSAKRLLRLLKKWAVWWWIVSFILQGSMVLERCSGMHILLMGRWNTVSKSDINPKSISSESIKFQKHIYHIFFISSYINIYVTMELHILSTNLPSAFAKTQTTVLGFCAWTTGWFITQNKSREHSK